MRLLRGGSDERAVSEIYGTLLIISLAFAVSVLLVGFGFVLLDDSLDETENQIAADSVTEFEQRVSDALQGAGNASTWEAPPGTENRFEADAERGKLTVHVETRGEYWNVTEETIDRPGALVDSLTREVERTRRLGTLVYENDDGSMTAYQGGAVFRKQGNSVTVQQPPSIDVSNGRLQLGVVDITSLPSVQSGSEMEIRGRSPVTNAIQTTIDDSIRRDGEVVAQSNIQLTVESEFAEGWATYAESELEGVENVTRLAENRVRIDLGTFGDGLPVENRSSSPVIYSGTAEFAAELHNSSVGTLAEREPGFEVLDPDPDEYTVGVFRATNETDGEREWWTWNESADHWENIERSNREVEPIDPLRDDRFGYGYDSFLLDDETVTCVVDTSAPGESFGDFVDDAGSGCLANPVGVDNAGGLVANRKPYLEVTDIDVTGPQRLEPNSDTLDVSVTVENTGPGDAEEADVALFLDDRSDDGLSEVVVTSAETNVSRGSTETVIDTEVDPHFLYESGEGGVPFRLGVATDDTEALTNDSYRIGFDAAINVTGFDLDETTITAGEPITGEIDLKTNATGQIDTSGLVTAGPNSAGFTASFTDTTTVDFTLNTDPRVPDFGTVVAGVPGEDNATASINVVDPRADPQFRVQNVTYDPVDRNVSVGEELGVEVTIKNVGNVRDTQPVQLANTRAGILAAEGAVTLDPGASTTVDLSWEPTARDANSYPESDVFVVTSTNRSALRTVFIESVPEDSGEFALSVRNVDREIVAGEVLFLEAEVENVGSERATRTLWLTPEESSGVADRRELTLDPGERTAVTLTWDTDRGDARPSQNRDLLVRTREGEAEAGVTVFRRSEAPDPTLAAVEPGNQTVTEGEPATVTATVENTAGNPAAGVVVLETDGGVPVDSAEVTPLPAGQSREVSLTWETVLGDAGRRNVTVRVGSDARSADVEVKQRYNPRDVAFVHDESRSMLAEEDVADVNAGNGVRLATNVNGINASAFFVSPGEMTVPGTQSNAYWNVTDELRDGLDQVWRAEAANGSVEYFYTGETVPVDEYESIEVLAPDHRLEAFERDTGTTTVTAEEGEIWFDVFSCYLDDSYCWLFDPVLPTESASTLGEGFAGFDLETVAEIEVDDEIPNIGAEFYAADGELYRNLGALESAVGPLEDLSESEVTAWRRGPTLPEIVPPGQTWDSSGTLLSGLYRSGEDPETVGTVDIYPHGADPFANRHDMTRSLLGSLDPRLDQAGYVQFDSDTRTQTDLSTTFSGTLTSDFDQLNATLREDRGDLANLTAGIERGVAVLTGPDAEPTSESVMVLFSDGVHNGGGTAPADVAAAASEDVTIYTVGLGDRVERASAQRSRLREIANATGGEFYLAEDVSELSSQFDRGNLDSISLDQPSFEVEINRSAPGSRQFGETVEVPVEVRNVGNASGEQPVWLTDPFDETVVEQRSVALAPGNSTEITFSWVADPRDPAFDDGTPPTASGDLLARTAADSDSLGVSVEDDPAEFTIADLSLDTEPVAPTDNATVSATIENTGAATGTQRVWLRTPWGEPVDSTMVELDGGETATATLSWDLSESRIAGDQTAVSVSSDDDSASTTVAIARAASLPAFEVSDIDTNADVTDGESIEAGETLDVTATVENTGDQTATQYVELSARAFDAGAADVRPVELDPGESTEIDLQWQTTVRDVPQTAPSEFGTVQIRPENGSSAESKRVGIIPFDPDVAFDLTIDSVNAEPPASITAGEDDLVVEVTLENDGSESDRALVGIRDVDAPADPSSALVLADLGEVAPGDTETATLVYRTKSGDETIDEIEAAVARYRVNATSQVNVTAQPASGDVGIGTVQTNAQRRPAAITAGEVPLVAEVDLTGPAAVLNAEHVSVSLYEGRSRDPGALLDTRTIAPAEPPNATLVWRPGIGEGDNAAPRIVTVAVRGSTRTEQVFVNESPSRLVGSSPGPDSPPVQITVDEVEVTD